MLEASTVVCVAVPAVEIVAGLVITVVLLDALEVELLVIVESRVSKAILVGVVVATVVVGVIVVPVLAVVVGVTVVGRGTTGSGSAGCVTGSSGRGACLLRATPSRCQVDPSLPGLFLSAGSITASLPSARTVLRSVSGLCERSRDAGINAVGVKASCGGERGPLLVDSAPAEPSIQSRRDAEQEVK